MATEHVFATVLPRTMLAVALGIGGLAVVSVAAPSAAPARPAPVGSGAFTPLPGARLLDTRQGSGALRSGEVRPLQVSGTGGVPVSGVQAVVLTVTVAAPGGTGSVTVYPGGALYPGTPTVNFVAGQTVSNTAIVRLSGSGQVSLRNAAGSVQLVVDVNGWYSAGDTPVAGGFVPVTGVRLTGGAAVLQGGTPLVLPVAGVHGIPAGASAAVLNLTGTAGTTASTLTVWPAGDPRPATSVLNLVPGGVATNLVVVKLGRTGALALAAGGGATNVVVELVGYILGVPTDPTEGGGTTAVQPYRVLDTRTMGSRAPVGAGHAIEVHPSTNAAVPVSGVLAVLLTITAASATVSGGYVTAWASGTDRPASSNLNPRTDRPVAVTALVAVGADGGVNLYNAAGSTHLIVDVTGYVSAPLTEVAPVRWSTMDTVPMSTGAAGQARQILLTANRYALSDWWPGAAVSLLRAPMDVNAQNDSSDAVRRLSMQAMSLAISLRTGAYDATTVGVSTGTATSVATALVDRVAGAHLANRANGWGDSWQSALWSSIAGRAGWLLWGDLAAGTRLRVARMVRWEADESLLQPVRYMRDRAGTLLHPGDTDAEDDAWSAMAPALATAMFPDSPHWTAWRHRQEQLQIAAWSRPADTSSAKVVDGQPLRAWLDGSNVEPNGVVINHQRVAPDYSTNAYQNLDTVFMAALAGQSAPQSTLLGLDAVYRALSTASYAAPPNQAPGGTAYRTGSATVYYPQGCDWGTGQQLPYALFDAQAAVFGFGPAGTAAGQSVLHATAGAAMQARTPSGASYLSPSTEYHYVGREEHTAQLAAQLYLTYFVQRLGFRVGPSVSAWSAGL